MNEITVIDVECCNPDLGRAMFYFTEEGKIAYGPVKSFNNLSRPTDDVEEAAQDLAFKMGKADWAALVPSLNKLKETFSFSNEISLT